jgi:hypothetical protein
LRCRAGGPGREQANGNYEIVFVSTLTGTALPYEDDLTLDDVELWINENVETEH